MTGKERLLTAMRRGMADAVAVSPDISNMIPCRLTGKPYWDIYLHSDPPLASAYLSAAHRFGFDPFLIHVSFIGGNSELDIRPGACFSSYNICIPDSLVKSAILERSEAQISESKAIETPHGPLELTTVYPRESPPWEKRKLIRDIREDFRKLRWLMGEEWRFHEKCIDYDSAGPDGIYAVPVELPVDWWHAIRDGGTEQALLDYFTHRDELREIFAYYTEYSAARLAAVLKAKPDAVQFQGSASSLSLISPKIYREYNIPFLRRMVKMCREAGVIAHQHTCGRSWKIIEMNHAEVDLDSMEPLERPPTGDVDMASAKKAFGDRFALKGNISTVGPLLSGTPAEVERDVAETLEAGMPGGGFVLSTGDQIGGNTPLENIEALVAAGRKYGKY